jgi:hypothetical protein
MNDAQGRLFSRTWKNKTFLLSTIDVKHDRDFSWITDNSQKANSFLVLPFKDYFKKKNFNNFSFILDWIFIYYAIFLVHTLLNTSKYLFNDNFLHVLDIKTKAILNVSSKQKNSYWAEMTNILHVIQIY